MRGPLPVVRRVVGRATDAVRRGVARRSLPRAGGLWVSLRLDASLGELPLPHRQRDAPASLLDALLVLDQCARDPRVEGVLLRVDGPPPGWSAAQSLRRAIEAVRLRGARVVVYAEQLDAVSLLAASAASRIWLPESGRLFLVGVRAEGLFLRGLLEHVDVRPEVVRIGTHKAAAEMFTRESMSPEQREQMDALVDDLFDVLVDGIARGRGLTQQEVRDRIDRGPYTAAAAREAGLIDDCVYPDELEARLSQLTPAPRAEQPGPRRVTFVEARVYRALALDPTPVFAAPLLGYVVAQGSIHRGGASHGIGSDELVRTLDRLRSDPNVRGLVLRIDSPGGDALASDLLWRAVDRVRSEKPVVASMSEVAASGGYYLASAADAVLAEATTVTGSIGVVGGKLNLEGLYRRLGVGRDGVERGRRAGLLSETRGFTADERRAVRGEMETLYATFIDRVARGRGLAVDAVHRVAQGRVWSGARAQSHGLVDAQGGPLEAIRELRSRAGVLPGEPAGLVVLPRMPRLSGLRTLLRWVA